MFSGSPTIADCIAKNSRPAGFDYLRMGLALLIIADHSIVACLAEAGQKAVFSSWGRPIIMALVPMFFALSGYLVATSLVRVPNLTTFISLRILRIFPALVVDTAVTALIIGAALTTLPLGEYFTSPTFWRYMLNMVGHIHYDLPGLFKSNPVHSVNVQLWTIPYELECYVTLTVLALFTLHRRRNLMLLVSCVISAAIAFSAYRSGLSIIDTWQLLVPSFLFGVCAYLFRDMIPWNSGLALISVVAAVVFLSKPAAFSVLAAIPLTYLTVWLGYFDPPRDPITKSGDYSYPLYLYSFPIQQAIIVVFPWGGIWWCNLLVAIPVSFALAYFSWHFVEKPFQGLRQYIGKTSVRSALARVKVAGFSTNP